MAEITTEVLETIEKIAKRFSKKFRFGYHDSEDIKQQARLYALEGLSKYEQDKGPLENFLSVHVRNQLINLKRNTYFRLTPPCIGCPFFDEGEASQCRAFDDKTDCKMYYEWVCKTENRKSLMTPAALSSAETSNELNVEDEITHKELVVFIDNRLEISLRADFKKILEGLSVPQHRKNKVREAISFILEEFNGRR